MNKQQDVLTNSLGKAAIHSVLDIASIATTGFRVELRVKPIRIKSYLG